MINYFLIFGCFALLILLTTSFYKINQKPIQQDHQAKGSLILEDFLAKQLIKCGYNTNTKPCFYGSIYFQNCDGKYLNANKPYNRLEWGLIPSSKSCFLLRKPLFDIEPDLHPDVDKKYFCSIESNRFPNYF